MIPILIPTTAIDLITGYEGIAGYDAKTNLYYPYHVKGDKSGVMTVGRGHVLKPWEFALKRGLTIDQVDSLFQNDLQPRAQRLKNITGFWDINQFAAALCGFYNDEEKWMPGSTVLMRHKRGDFTGAAEAILDYHNANGKPLLGLWRRCGSEALLYLTGRVIVANTGNTEKELFTALKDAGVYPVWPIFSNG